MIYLRDIRTDSCIYQYCMDAINENQKLKEEYENGDDIIVGKIVKMKAEN